MTAYLVTAYVLVWPIIALGVLIVLSLGVYRDLKLARTQGDEVV